VSNPIYDLDRAVQAALQDPAMQLNGFLQFIAKVFNWWGGPGVIYFAALLWLIGRWRKLPRASMLGLRGVEAIAIASAINSIIKALTGRVRPFVTPDEPWFWRFNDGWSNPHYQSMPSGHTITTMAFAAAITVVAIRFDSFERFGIAFIAYASALLVAFSRLYSNQHWFSDVFVGAALGIATGLYLARWHEQHLGSAFDKTMLGPAAE
jgi:membrane-associated phospholipid phosphatase